jgi:hypothetical protein
MSALEDLGLEDSPFSDFLGFELLLEDPGQDQTKGVGLADHHRRDAPKDGGGVLAGQVDAGGGHSSSILRTSSPSCATV